MLTKEQHYDKKVAILYVFPNVEPTLDKHLPTSFLIDIYKSYINGLPIKNINRNITMYGIDQNRNIYQRAKSLSQYR